MVNLTFGEQVKIILNRKGMTIKCLAELMEEHTGKPMSRQNLTQRLGRDNFQEQDMRVIAKILGCKFQLSILETDGPDVADILSLQERLERRFEGEGQSDEMEEATRDITVGELVDITDESQEVSNMAEEETESAEENAENTETEENVDVAEVSEEGQKANETDERKLLKQGIRGYFKKAEKVDVSQAKTKEQEEAENEPVLGEINPYTGKEYKTNSVRMHPKRIGYVQVYDQEQHKWTDMTEWAFLGYQERKKVLLGRDYEPPTYLD